MKNSMKHQARRLRRYRRYSFALLFVAAAIIVAAVKPSDRGAPYDKYFTGLNRELSANGPGRPAAILDLDRMDRNLDLMKKGVGDPRKFRLVVESLPSIPLIRYICGKMDTKRLMVFHQPDLNFLAEKIGGGYDILLGKPMPVRAVREFYATLRAANGFNPATDIQWLVDTPARMTEYDAFAREKKIKMRISIEIDVGLHRGGVISLDDLDAMLAVIAGSGGRLTYSGFMGYDVHVGAAPALFRTRDGAVRSAFEKMLARYRSFYDRGRAKYPDLFTGDLTFNSGGSTTYPLLAGTGPVNDIAAGSALVKPSDFDTPLLEKHEAAFFIATPVLKSLRGTTIPYLELLSIPTRLWNKNRQRTYIIYGGGWRAAYISPAGLEDNPIYPFSTNQAFVNGSDRTALSVDDYVFLRPTQSEGVMREFGDILVIRGGKITERWPAFPE